MKTTPEDKCGVCGKRVWDMEWNAGYQVCPFCGSFICDPCIEESKKERGDVYPCCGKDWIKTK